MEPIVGIVIGLLLLLAIVTFMSVRDQNNKKRIDTEIRSAGGQPIEIAFQFVGYDRDNQHYNVEFTDALGRKHATRCKVNIWQNSLFWQQTPAELLSDVPVENDRWRRLSYDSGNSKEQIINDLVAENERLREQLMHTESSNGGYKSYS